MDNSELYEQCKVALHELNSNGFIYLKRYTPEIENLLLQLGARPAQGEICRSPATRSAELGKELDRRLETEQRILRSDKYAHRADVKSTISLIVAGISVLIALLSMLLAISYS